MNGNDRYRGPFQLRPKFHNVVYGALTGTAKCDGLDTRKLKDVALLKVTRDRLLRRRLSSL